MKRVSKFNRADKLAFKLTKVKTIANLGDSFSPHYVQTLLRLAYMKGHKAGMDRRHRIANNRERAIRAMTEHKRIADLMG